MVFKILIRKQCNVAPVKTFNNVLSALYLIVVSSIFLFSVMEMIVRCLVNIEIKRVCIKPDIKVSQDTNETEDLFNNKMVISSA